MSKFKTEVVVKADPKNKDFYNIYFIGVPVFYAKVQEPDNKFESKDKEFSVQVFVDEKTKDKILDEHLINKSASLVGVDKNKKRAIRFPIADQVKEGKNHYGDVEGLYGIQLSVDELTKQGKKRKIKVIDDNNKPMSNLVGNMSICTVKCWGYKDGFLNIKLDTVKVHELVVYEGSSGDGMVEDEILGTYQAYTPNTDESEEEVEEKPKSKSKAKPKPTPEEDSDDEDFDLF